MPLYPGDYFYPVRVAVPCFCGAGRGPLAKSRPLPLLRLAASAAGSASAAQPPAHRGVPLSLRGSPLALSRFLRRAAAGACKNRSAAPASPRCFCRRQRSAQLPPFGGSWPMAAPSSSSWAATVRQGTLRLLRSLQKEEAVFSSEPRQGRGRRPGGSAMGGGWV